MIDGRLSADFKYYTTLLFKDSKEVADSNVVDKLKEIPLCERSLWKKYRYKVWKITKKQNIKKLLNFEKRAFKGYHLDHKVSIWYGYKHTLCPKMIGGIDNLEFIPYKDNMRKGIRCNFDGFKGMQKVLFID